MFYRMQKPQQINIITMKNFTIINLYLQQIKQEEEVEEEVKSFFCHSGKIRS